MHTVALTEVVLVLLQLQVVAVAKCCTVDLAVAHFTMISLVKHAVEGHPMLKTKGIPHAHHMIQLFGKYSKIMEQTTVWPLTTHFLQLQKAVQICVENKLEFSRMVLKCPVVHMLSLMVVQHVWVVERLISHCQSSTKLTMETLTIPIWLKKNWLLLLSSYQNCTVLL